MNIDISLINTALLIVSLIIGGAVKSSLSDLKHRIVRMENKFLNIEGDEPWDER